MAVDAPTVNRHSLLLGLVVALSPGWTIRIGDIRAAFLNGVQSSRRLFFRQPARGIPGLRPGQLVEILKGVFWFGHLAKALVVEAIYRSATKDISHNQDQQYGWNYGQYDQWGQYGQSVQYDHNDPQSHQVLLHAAQPTSTSKPSTAYSDKSSYYQQ